MLRDRFYRQIEQRLAERLDPELFERCATDLLRRYWPTLVPVRGGSDAGRDGAIADGEGRAFPLVCTTGQDVIGNLTDSLTSYVANGGPRRKVVLATSQLLTEARRRNLEERAEELGFELVQVCDGAAIANLLYYSPAWCRELLNLTGDPPALSALPRTSRPLIDAELIGRDADLEWLTTTTGDQLLVGQPGAGKTALLHNLARNGWGLFVVSDDLGRIAESIRAEQPAVLIVDDAHVDPDLLGKLVHLRSQVGASFRIVATSWPGDARTVATTLQVSAAQIRELEPLTRDEIVKVVEGAGLGGPSRLIREIVDQVEGRPGLAVTLARICLTGDVRDVALGAAIARDAYTLVERLVGRTAVELLAAFALGGDVGMRLADVAAVLNLQFIDGRATLARLAAAGVIAEARRYPGDPTRLAVYPAALRHVLVRDIFFSPPALDCDQLIARAPDLAEVAQTLVRARAVGAVIAPDTLRWVLLAAGSDDAWAAYAWLGQAEARWVVTVDPAVAVREAFTFLRQAPEVTLPLLLEQAIGDDRPLHAHPEHPIRQVQDWLQDTEPEDIEAVRRRALLVGAAATWLKASRDRRVGVRAACLALSPALHRVSTDPGAGMTATLHYGLLSSERLGEVVSLWPQLVDLLQQPGDVAWTRVLDAIEDWVYPSRKAHGVSVPTEIRTVMRSAAGQMLRACAALATDRPGVLHRLKRLAADLRDDVNIPTDPDFETLFAEWDREDWRAAEAAHAQAVRQLAAQWRELQPAVIAQRLAHLEREASLAEVRWPRGTPMLCAELARECMMPTAWLGAMTAVGVPADLAIPFLRRAAQLDEAGWENAAMVCVQRPEYGGAVITLVLTMPTPPAPLLAQVLERLDGFGQLVETWCLRGEVPTETLTQLLRHPDPLIAGAAAIGEWLCEPKGTVRPGLERDWRRALLRQERDEYWLGQILRGDSQLAHDWLWRWLTLPMDGLADRWDTMEAAIDGLDADGRRCLLRRVPTRYPAEQIIARIVGDDVELYRALLADERLRRYRLAPLGGRPVGSWASKAQVALAAGFPPKEVAAAAYGAGTALVTVEWSGNESNMWDEWVEQFSELAEASSIQMRLVAEEGVAIATRRRDRARAGERREAVYRLA